MGEGSASCPGRSLLPGKTRYLLYRRLGGPQGRSGQVPKISSPGFDPRTVQPVANYYTDNATRPTKFKIAAHKSGNPTWSCKGFFKNSGEKFRDYALILPYDRFPSCPSHFFYLPIGLPTDVAGTELPAA